MNITGHLAAIRSKGLSVRTYLVGLVAAILLPALLFGGWLTLRSADSERALLEANSETKARQVVADIDHEIALAKAMLTALASSHILRNRDFGAFHRQAVDVARQFNAHIILRDAASGRQIVNTATPWGQPLPEHIPPESLNAMQESIRTGKPAVSNVFPGAVTKKFLVAVGIPVMHLDSPVYYLLVGIPVDTFAAALANAALPDRWVVTLTDRVNTVVARSQLHKDFAGTKLLSDLAGRAMPSGVSTGVDRHGVRYRWVWSRSELTGWFISVGVPMTALEAPAKRALSTYSAASSTLFVVAIALSFLLGTRLSQSVGEMGIDRKPTRDEFRMLFESAPNGVLVVDSIGLMVLANERLERKFGYSRGELIGQPVEMLVPERFRNGHLSLRRAFSPAPKSRPMGAGRELFGSRKDGSEFPIEIGLNPITTRNGNFVMATVVDISLRMLSGKNLSAALTERDHLRRRLMQVQEDERLRLAHELHDQTGQSLTAALLELKGLETLMKEDGRHRVRTLRKSMEQMGKTLHRIAWELRPASIDELGLTSALGNYIAEWGHQFAIDADFHSRDARLDFIADDTRTTIYRIVQEALTNIAKHARGATSVSIVVDRSDSVLRLTVEDNGPGFETAAATEPADKRRGLGIPGMRERLTLIGGELEIESSEGVGTTIFARIPLDNEKLIA